MTGCRIFLGVALVMLAAPPFLRAQTGEVRVHAGAMTGLGADGAPLKTTINGSFSFVKAAFSFGPEMSYAFGEQHILGLGVVTRVRLGAKGWRPYLVGGLGGNYWKRDGYVTAGLFTGSIGAGIRLPTRGGPDLTLETRIHKNLQNYAGGGNWDFVSVAAGVRLGW